CPLHGQEPLELFCTTCDTLTCQRCHLTQHQDHRSQTLDEAVRKQRKALAALVQRLGDKQANLQRNTREL
ncbi:Transcription intermediary factor 1-beta, partial [Acanthisitta chloris]